MATTGRVDYLDGIRAVAIGAVLSLHWLSWYSPLFHGGSIGVDVFFVLSGFIITTMLWRSPAASSVGSAWVAFLRRRAIRLYPALLGFVLLSTVLYAVTPRAPVKAVDVLDRGVLALGQLSAIWAAVSDNGLWPDDLNPFGQTWSLAIEWYFYLLWPLVVLGSRTRGVNPRTLAATSVGLACVLYAASLPLGTAWFYYGFSARAAELIVGAALALWLTAAGPAGPNKLHRVTRPAPALALAALCGYSLLAPDASSPAYRYVGVPVAVLATVVLIHVGYGARHGRVQQLLAHPFLATIGRHSYSLYLWHMIPVLLLQDLTAAVPKPVVGLLAAGVTALVTFVSYRLLERPFLRPRSDVLLPHRAHPEDTAVRKLDDEIIR